MTTHVEDKELADLAEADIATGGNHSPPAPRREETVGAVYDRGSAIARPVGPFDKIVGAIADIMAKLRPVEKHGYNEFHKYFYAGIGDISTVLTPLMGEHGIVIFQTEVSRTMFDNNNAISISYEFTIVHKSGQVYPDRPLQTGLSSCRNRNGGFDDKSINKCHTAARKYFLMSLFQIPTKDADDADAEGDAPVQDSAPPRRGRDQGGPPRRDDAPPQRSAPAPQARKEWEPPATPQAIEGGKDAREWADMYIKAIGTAGDVQTVLQWAQTNRANLDKVDQVAPFISEDIREQTEKHLAWLKKTSAGSTSEAGGKTDTAPKADKPPKRSSAKKSKIKAADPVPVDPEEKLQWVDAQLAEVQVPDDLAEVWAIKCEAVVEGLDFPKDKDEAQAIYRRHEQRLGID